MRRLVLLSLILFLSALMLQPSASASAPGAYVELSWPLDESYNFDIDMKITDAPESGGLFWSHQFGFVGGSGGYLGLQIVGSTHKAIFSIWGALAGNPDRSVDTSGPETFYGCRPFTGEGTGWQCLTTYDWKIGINHRLRLWAVSKDSSGNEWWVAAVYDYSTESETVIGNILVPSSYGWLGSWSVTWVEYFIYSTCDAPHTRAVFSYPFARNAGGDHAPRTAKATYGSGECTNSDISYLGNGAYVIEAGQNVQRATPDQTMLWTEEPQLVRQAVPEFTTAHSAILILTILSALILLRRRYRDGRCLLGHC